jgi:hypothetical protein
LEAGKKSVPQDQLFEYETVQKTAAVDDTVLVRRVADAYRLMIAEFGGHGTSFWQSFEAKHADFSAAFASNDLTALGHLLRSPAETELFWGFDDLVKPFVKFRNENAAACEDGARTIYDSLVQLAVAVGTLRAPYPEAGQSSLAVPVEQILEGLDRRFGFRVDFQNPFAFDFGVKTSRGVASHRSIQAIYQAWRVKQLADHVGGSKILEIGAGLGRNAYYARKFGLNRYTIVDIPATQLAQGYYLGRVIGADKISLCGEPDNDVRLRSPSWLHSSSETFDVVLNADSLTEMDRGHALRYVKFARDRSPAFLSINHEFNETAASQLFDEAGMKVFSRSPYWPRPGYVEEVHITQRNTDMQAVLKSTSWRVTAPLRWLRSASLRFSRSIPN